MPLDEPPVEDVPVELQDELPVDPVAELHEPVVGPPTVEPDDVDRGAIG